MQWKIYRNIAQRCVVVDIHASVSGICPKCEKLKMGVMLDSYIYSKSYRTSQGWGCDDNNGRRMYKIASIISFTSIVIWFEVGGIENNEGEHSHCISRL